MCKPLTAPYRGHLYGASWIPLVTSHLELLRAKCQRSSHPTCLLKGKQRWLQQWGHTSYQEGEILIKMGRSPPPQNDRRGVVLLGLIQDLQKASLDEPHTEQLSVSTKLAARREPLFFGAQSPCGSISRVHAGQPLFWGSPFQIVARLLVVAAVHVVLADLEGCLTPHSFGLLGFF